MLYLIRTFGRCKRTAVKIGFSDNLDSRLNSYYIQNPFFEVISSRSGDEILEMKIHLFLTALGYKESFLNEWFIDCPEVLSLFHSKLSKIDNIIWKNRDSLFQSKDFKNNGNKLKSAIYETLRNDKFLKYEKNIDCEWRIENQKKNYKKLKKQLNFGGNDYRIKNESWR